jgi:glycosyltransferase involved in cell wall biosynthesis
LLTTSIVIPTRNNISTVDQCLSSLRPYYEQGYISEIVVVDAHSTDGTLEVLENHPVKVVCDEGQVYAVAEDIGWRNTEGELIIFFDADAYLEGNFFPEVHKFFSDERIGVIGCQAKAVVTNGVTRAQAEHWSWATPMLSTSAPLFQRLYGRIASGGHPQVLPGGPCQVVRRICLEAVNGFPHYSHNADVYLSERIVEKGWKAAWWVDSPLCHYPRPTIKGLVKQHYRLGKELGQGASLGSRKKGRSFTQRLYQMLRIVSCLGSPLVASMLAIRFRNPMHLIVYPPPRYAGAIGYIVGWIGARNKKGRNPNQSSN